MPDLLSELHDDLLAAEQARPRSQQTAIGASQAMGCRAEAMFRLRGVPESDPRLGWQALVGTGLHEQIQRARENDPRYIVERRYTYRDVPCTVDMIDTERRLACDWKTKDAPAKYPNEPRPEWFAQVNLGAMAAREAGVEVEQVAIVCLPRSGEFEPVQFGPYPVDPAVANEAADRVAEINALAESDADPRDYRDEPPMFCRRFCSWVTACRGEPQPEQPLDDDVADLAAEYDTARADRDKAAARMDQAREQLTGLSGQAGDWIVKTTGGRDKTEQVEDTDQLRQLWRFVNSTDPPTAERVKTTPVRLTVKRAES